MQAEAFGIIITNAILILAGVWRMSALISKLESHLQHLNETFKVHSAESGNKFTAIEARILNLERGART